MMDIATKYEIQAMPTFVFFKNGEEVSRIQGADINGIIYQIQGLLGNANDQQKDPLMMRLIPGMGLMGFGSFLVHRLIYSQNKNYFNNKEINRIYAGCAGYVFVFGLFYDRIVKNVKDPRAKNPIYKYVTFGIGIFYSLIFLTKQDSKASKYLTIAMLSLKFLEWLNFFVNPAFDTIADVFVFGDITWTIALSMIVMQNRNKIK